MQNASCMALLAMGLGCFLMHFSGDSQGGVKPFIKKNQNPLTACCGILNVYMVVGP